MKRRIAFAAALAVLLAGCASRPETEYERYTNSCHARGGFISSHAGWSEFTYECLGQTTGPVLPPMRK